MRSQLLTFAIGIFRIVKLYLQAVHLFALRCPENSGLFSITPRQDAGFSCFGKIY